MQKDRPPSKPTPENETPFQRFQRLAKQIVSAPKEKAREREKS
jgi:hypothetical protein